VYGIDLVDRLLEIGDWAAGHQCSCLRCVVDQDINGVVLILSAWVSISALSCASNPDGRFLPRLVPYYRFSPFELGLEAEDHCF
jgi:hypothetical protein